MHRNHFSSDLVYRFSQTWADLFITSHDKVKNNRSKLLGERPSIVVRVGFPMQGVIIFYSLFESISVIGLHVTFD